jgi:hypothetical protein
MSPDVVLDLKFLVMPLQALPTQHVDQQRCWGAGMFLFVPLSDMSKSKLCTEFRFAGTLHVVLSQF